MSVTTTIVTIALVVGGLIAFLRSCDLCWGGHEDILQTSHVRDAQGRIVTSTLAVRCLHCQRVSPGIIVTQKGPVQDEDSPTLVLPTSPAIWPGRLLGDLNRPVVVRVDQ